MPPPPSAASAGSASEGAASATASFPASAGVPLDPEEPSAGEPLDPEEPDEVPDADGAGAPVVVAGSLEHAGTAREAAKARARATRTW